MTITTPLTTDKKSLSLKTRIKMSTLQLNLALVKISEEFRAAESREVRFKRNGYDFSIDYNATDKSNILNTPQY